MQLQQVLDPNRLALFLYQPLAIPDDKVLLHFLIIIDVNGRSIREGALTYLAFNLISTTRILVDTHRCVKSIGKDFSKRSVR